MIRMWCKRALFVGILSAAATAGGSSILETTITYVGSETVYLGAGTVGGVEKGDSAEVWRNDQVIARLEIIYVAQSSSSARIVVSSAPLHVGDRVHLAVKESPVQGSTAAATQGAEIPAFEDSVSAGTPRPHPATRIYGRVALQIIQQDDREAANADATKPALLLRTTIENLFYDHLNLSVNLRARQITQREGETADLQSEWDNRLYEFALQYDNPASALNYQVGRISSNLISGIGPFDGALIEYELQQGWSTGIFGGTRPDLTNSAFSAEETTAGLYAAYEAGAWAGRQVRGTVAFAGRYHTGQIDEEFIYEQVRYNWSRSFSLTQSAEMAINRDWRQQAEGSSWGLSNVLVNAAYSPSNALTLDFGYDNRKLMRTYETRDTPDSLFDDALRQGFRAGLQARLPLGLRARLSAGLRTRDTGETETRTLLAGLSRNNLFGSGITTSAQLNLFDNRLSSGYQTSLALARYFFRVFYLQFDTGLSKYELTTAEGPVSYHWFHLDASSYLTRHLYGSAYGEAYRGDAMNTNRFGVELGYRF